MASCEDDFSLLGDENPQSSHRHHHHPPPPPPPHHHHLSHQASVHPFHHRFINKPLTNKKPNEEVEDDEDDYADTAFCADADDSAVATASKCPPPPSSAFNHHADPVACFTTSHQDEDPPPFAASHEIDAGDDADHKSLTVVRPENNNKRKDREDLSDGGSPYCLSKKPSKQLMWSVVVEAAELNRGNLRGRDWEEVATAVSERCDRQKPGKSVEQCKNKVDNLKKRYKAERHRLSSGSLSVSHWPWFKKLEQIVGSSPSSNKPISDEDRAGAGAGAAAGATSSSSGAIIARQNSNKRYAVAAAGHFGATNSLKIKSLSNPRWRRVIFKISGAALAGDPENVGNKITMIAKEVAMAINIGVEASLEKHGVQARIQTTVVMQEIAEPYIRRRAIRHLEKGRVVIFGGFGAGMANPLFTTDVAAALRASEVGADAVLKGISMDGVYDCHSRNSGGSLSFEHVSFQDLLTRGFTAMDMTALTFCEQNSIPVVVFNLLQPGNISRALCGDQIGTLIDQSGSIS
ncbi:hypothetical protein QJS10_CPA08g00516 [Acorus calamus]|uniref:UMP kinase n=1 Tax=Acorus calamus TaxID=4465 RepID=A0AAV9EAW5_ACOCL|nr:hypothetical protein QJS10_CPA08g00516 [Acorus calamus]